MKEYVIIGNGTAATGCIEGIRSIDTESKITVVSAERHPVYCRPLISYYLEGKTDLERMQYRSANFYDKMGCKVLYGKTAAKIDTKTKRVLLEDGTALPYTAVCVAAGSSPFIPPMVGAGLIGLKCAEGLRDRVADITVCDLSDRVLSSILDTECAAMMQAHLEANGIHFLLGDSAARFEKNTAFMKSGKTVDFDVLVLAVGVRANTSLVSDGKPGHPCG